MQKIYGYTAEEAIGRPISILTDAGQPEETPELLARVGRGESVNNYETVRRRKERDADGRLARPVPHPGRFGPDRRALDHRSRHHRAQAGRRSGQGRAAAVQRCPRRAAGRGSAPVARLPSAFRQPLLPGTFWPTQRPALLRTLFRPRPAVRALRDVYRDEERAHRTIGSGPGPTAENTTWPISPSPTSTAPS